ncbi:RNA-guided endonuclease InsQ/TnpB family protein [Rhabdochromatium marinum]|uniref:RNA-guided endonuclease InsQ/TnpB family protein n=1 Tax=Rhabdochromatium marinum TaxID=48729 RepID=UPI001906B6E0|nr:RNA-guided endonuclease TnpB family protein [Rhabdochromatium marinum]MBK1649820.1 transposase [Rhabdochromatium marinum]
MLLAHKIELRPTAEQADYLARACGSKRHCYNQLLGHFKQNGVKWSKAAAYQHYIKVLRPQFPWYNEVSARVTRNAIDDLDNAFKHFFRRVKLGQTPGFPTFKKKGVGDSFALREKPKFDVDGRTLRIEKLKTRIKMRQTLRFTGTLNQVTISMRAGKFYASILVETQDYDPHAPDRESVGVDFGLKSLAVLSDGTEIPANQKLKANLKKLARKQRHLSRKQPKSNRQAKAKLAVAKLHKRVSDQRQAVLHELSDNLTRNYQVITIEDLNVRGMVRNRKLARTVSDAGFGTLRQMLTYKAELRGVELVVADRFFPSSKMCSACGQVHEMPLDKRTMECDCGNVVDRDLNAAVNLNEYGRAALLRDPKRTQEPSKTASAASVMTA